MIKLNKKGLPALIEERIDLASVAIQTESGNPYHDPNTGRFSYAPPGVAILRGDNLIRGLSTATRRELFRRAKLSLANQLSAQVINGRLHLVLLRDGRRVHSFAVESKQQKENGQQEEESQENFDVAFLDTTLDAARNLDLQDERLFSFIEERIGRKLLDQEKNEINDRVRKQRIEDLVVYLHQNLRRKLEGKKDTDKVRILAPRGYLRKSFSKINTDDAREVLQRLQHRGWEESIVQEHVEESLPKRLKSEL